VDRAWPTRTTPASAAEQAESGDQAWEDALPQLGRPEQASSWIGARSVHYFEAYWGANPGLYQWFIYSINDAGYGGFDAGWDLEHMEAFSWGFPDDVMPDSQLARVQPAHGAEDAKAQGLGSSSNDSVADAEPAHEPSFEKHSEEPLPAFYDAFRRNAKINTYTVLGPELALDDYPFFTRLPEDPPTIFGPNSDRTRTLAGQQN